jgi:hypothetical protein
MLAAGGFVNSVLTRLSVVVAAALVAAAVVEIALRAGLAHLPVPFLIYLNPRIREGSPAVKTKLRAALPVLSARKEDPDVGWTFQPDMDWSGTNEDGEKYSARTSPEGFFTPDRPGKAERQLILLGDSFLSTFYVRRPIQNVIRDVLGVPTYNLAAGGWGPESYLAAYRKFAAGRRHDLAVVFSFNNDISDVENWQRWKRENSSESFQTWIQDVTSRDLVNLSQSWPDTHLVVWNVVRFFVDRPAHVVGLSAAEAPRRERYHGFDVQFAPGLSFLVHDPDAFFPGGEYYDSVAAYLDALRRLKAAIEADHARMVLVWIPSQERVYLPLLSAERRATYVTNSTHDISGLEQMLHRFTEREGLDFLDLVEPLAMHAQAGEKLYFTVDAHLNSLGNEVAGHIVADFIRHLPAAPPAKADELPLAQEHPAIDRPLLPSQMVSHANIISISGNTWTARGKGDAQYSYLARWPELNVDAPQELVVKGVLRRGGLTIGLLKNDRWALVRNVTTAGPFELVVPVSESGRYAPLIANCLPKDSLENDFDITSFGWTTSH